LKGKKIIAGFFVVVAALAFLLCFVTAEHQVASLENVNIRVDRNVELKVSGQVVITDNFQLYTNPGVSVQPIRSFLIGFTIELQHYFEKCYAFNPSKPEERFDLVMGVPLGEDISVSGYYGIEIVFPTPVELSDGKSYNFTVVLIFSGTTISNKGTEETKVWYEFDFPEFPTLVKDAEFCNVTVALPDGATSLSKSRDMKSEKIDNREFLTYSASPLRQLNKTIAWVTFKGLFFLFSCDELQHNVYINDWGDLSVTDVYTLRNLGRQDVFQVEINLPDGAYDVSARDIIGELQVTLNEPNETVPLTVRITIRESITMGEIKTFRLMYKLPASNYINQTGFSHFRVYIPEAHKQSFTIKKLIVNLLLPEGAMVSPESSVLESGIIRKDVLSQSLSYEFYNTTSFDKLELSVNFQHTPLWASFRPLILMGIFVGGVSIVAYYWSTHRKLAPIISIPIGALKRFVNEYDERRRIIQEIEAMEQKVRRGVLSRRRYKVRRNLLNARLSTLSKSLTELKEELRRVSSVYADRIRRIEMAETQREMATRDIEQLRERYRRKQLSKDAYNRLLSESIRRREKAENTIEEVILRFREELR